MNKAPNQHIEIALTKESIPAHIVYLSQTTLSNNTPNSTVNLTLAGAQTNKPEQASIAAYTHLITTQNSKLKTDNNPLKQVKPLKPDNKKNKNIEKIESKKSLTQPIDKDHHAIELNTTSATSTFSSAEEINNIMSQLQTALSNYLAKQPAPDKSISIVITLTINDQGIIEKINFSPLPSQALQDLLIEFLQSQNYTHKLLLPRRININIPLQLIATSYD